MNKILFSHSGDFPEDTIVRDKDYAGGFIEYYVYQGRVLVEVRRVHTSGPHYDLTRRLREKYDVEGPRDYWNPVNHRVDGGNTYSSVETPSRLIRT